MVLALVDDLAPVAGCTTRLHPPDVEGQRVGDVVVDHGQLLRHVADADVPHGQAERRPQAGVGAQVDAGHADGTHVAWDAIGLAVLQGGADAGPRVHPAAHPAARRSATRWPAASTSKSTWSA